MSKNGTKKAYDDCFYGRSLKHAGNPNQLSLFSTVATSVARAAAPSPATHPPQEPEPAPHEPVQAGPLEPTTPRPVSDNERPEEPSLAAEGAFADPVIPESVPAPPEPSAATTALRSDPETRMAKRRSKGGSPKPLPENMTVDRIVMLLAVWSVRLRGSTEHSDLRAIIVSVGMAYAGASDCRGVFAGYDKDESVLRWANVEHSLLVELTSESIEAFVDGPNAAVYARMCGALRTFYLALTGRSLPPREAPPKSTAATNANAIDPPPTTKRRTRAKKE